MKTFIAFMFFAFMALFAQAANPVHTLESPGISPPTEYAVPAVTPAVPESVPVVNKWPYGYRQLITLTGATTITVTTNNYTLTYATFSVAANTALTATVANSIVGDMIWLEVTADGTNRVLTFTGNITATAYTVTANKTVLLGFVFNGTKFIGASVLQVN